jgi:hypothetical protein
LLARFSGRSFGHGRQHAVAVVVDHQPLITR